MGEHVTKLGAVLNSTATELANSVDSDIESTKHVVANKFDQAKLIVNVPTDAMDHAKEVVLNSLDAVKAGGMDSLGSTTELINNRIQTLRGLIATQAALAKAVTNHSIERATDALIKVKTKTLEKHMYSFDPAEQEVVSALEDMKTRALAATAQIVDEAYSIMSNAIDTGINSQLSSVLTVTSSAIAKVSNTSCIS